MRMMKMPATIPTFRMMASHAFAEQFLYFVMTIVERRFGCRNSLEKRIPDCNRLMIQWLGLCCLLPWCFRFHVALLCRRMLDGGIDFSTYQKCHARYVKPEHENDDSSQWSLSLSN